LISSSFAPLVNMSVNAVHPTSTSPCTPAPRQCSNGSHTRRSEGGRRSRSGGEREFAWRAREELRDAGRARGGVQECSDAAEWVLETFRGAAAAYWSCFPRGRADPPSPPSTRIPPTSSTPRSHLSLPPLRLLSILLYPLPPRTYVGVIDLQGKGSRIARACR
jgi:hypothetical protein